MPINLIEQQVLDTNVGKQQSEDATDVKLAQVLKKGRPFKYILEL
jgi:hypothetical protein